MPMYYAIKSPQSNSPAFDREGAVQTNNYLYSMFCQAKTYNIRVRDLLFAFEATKDFFVFQDESYALKYMKKHTFSEKQNNKYYTYPLYQVEIKKHLDFNNENMLALPEQGIRPVAGRLLELDTHLPLDRKNGMYYRLDNPVLDNILYESQTVKPN